ncbi:hypothetical protein ACFQ0X_32480 [Streptomyces rectiviolaceus]|uniref:Secreted protein n=1 Tax=Streptomyces rectiviolaceus TaxID=332591 RepID=A0ABP6MZ93_9ACTN
MALHLRKCRIPIAAALVTPLFTPLPATAARASTAQRAASCTARSDPALATRLSRDIRAALAARRGTVSVAVHDPATGLSCALGSSHRYDTASAAKVVIMEAALRRARDWGRGLTAWERRRIRPMIIRSDNTVADRLRLLGALTAARVRALLSPRSRAYGLKQLNEVRRDQRWGVPAGMPRGSKAHIKNGWLPWSTHGRRVYSIGVFTGPGRARAYRVVVLSHDSPTMRYGVRTIERVAQAVHRALNKGRTAGQGLPDGSVPPEAPPEQDAANR